MTHSAPNPASGLKRRPQWLLIVPLVAAALIVAVAWEVDRQTVTRHEAQFLTRQARHAAAIRQALEAHMDALTVGASALARHAAGRHTAGAADGEALADLLATELIAFPDLLSCAIVTADGRALVVWTDPTAAGQASVEPAVAWVRDYAGLPAASAHAAYHPPPLVTTDAQLQGMIVPFSASDEPDLFLVAVIDLQPILSRYVVAPYAAEHGTAFVLDGRGTVVFDANAGAVGRNVFEGMGFDPDALRAFRRVVSEPSGSDEYRSRMSPDTTGEVRRLISWDSVRVGEHRLVIGLSAAASEVNATLIPLRRNLVLASGFVAATLVAMSALYFLGRQRLLERAAHELGRQVVERTAALDTVEATLQRVFDLTPVGSATLSANYRVERVNRAFCTALGYSAEALTAASWLDLLHPSDRDAGRGILDSLMARDSAPLPVELRHIRRDGHLVHCLFHATLIHDATHQPPRYLVQIQDVTEQKQAEERLRQRTAQLEALRQMALDLTHQLDLQTLLESIVAQAARLLPGAEAGLYLYDPQRDDLEWVVCSNPQTMVPPGTRLRRGEGLSGRVLESGRMMYVGDYASWPGRTPQYADHYYQWHTVAATPVRYGETMLGVLNLVTGPQATFSEADASVLDLYAAHAAIALRNAQLLERETHQRELAEALAAAAAAVSSTLDLDQVLDRILEQVQRVVGGSTANVALIENGVSRPVRWRGYERIGARVPLSQIGLVVAETTNLRCMVETGAPIVVDDTTTYPGWIDVPATQMLRSYVGAPIRLGDRTVGFLNIDSPNPGEFSAEDADRLAAFAPYAAIAIENARLYEQARRDAARAATLVEEINHRVKNNLSAILGLLYVEMSHARWQSGDDCDAILQDLAHRIQGLAALHTVLSETGWAALRLSDLSTRIIQSVLGVLAPDRSIRLEVSPSAVLVTPEQAHNLALIIHELAANVVEHAWPDRPGHCLSVQVSLEGDTVTLELRDDGVGYPEAVLAGQGGVGLFLVRNLVEHGLRGHLELRNEGGAVATVRFTQTDIETVARERDI